MSRSPASLLAPEDEELARKKARLAELEGQLADRELERASLLADLVHFEKRYLDSVGRRYAILDDLNAQIAEARAVQNPQRQESREEARRARSKAQESAQAVGDEAGGTPAPDEAASASNPNQSESLRKLYRQAAKLLHPDKTLDGTEKERRHHIMAELNDAYGKGDEERIRTILRDWHSSPESVQGDGPGAELVRVIPTHTTNVAWRGDPKGTTTRQSKTSTKPSASFPQITSGTPLAVTPGW
jgi:hypothetical protein